MLKILKEESLLKLHANSGIKFEKGCGFWNYMYYKIFGQILKEYIYSPLNLILSTISYIWLYYYYKIFAYNFIKYNNVSCKNI